MLSSDSKKDLTCATLRSTALKYIARLTKFIQGSGERLKARGRPPKHYHPLPEKEKELNIKVHSILP